MGFQPLDWISFDSMKSQFLRLLIGSGKAQTLSMRLPFGTQAERMPSGLERNQLTFPQSHDTKPLKIVTSRNPCLLVT